MVYDSATRTALVPLAPQHADEAARLHILGQPGTFLTALGPEVLAVVYRALPESTVGFGYAWTGPDGRLLGFAAVTTSTGRLFLEVGLRYFFQLLPLLVRRYLHRPSLLWHSLQTVFYPLLVEGGDEPEGSVAELLSIMVEPAARGQGIGGELMAAVLAGCQTRNITALDVTVDKANQGAQRFYRREGFILRKEMQIFGRPMVVYRREG